MPPSSRKRASARWPTLLASRSGVDLAPLFQRTLERVVSRARRREASGDRPGAAADFRQAATLAARLAGAASTHSLRETRRREVRGLEEAAARLEAPGTPGAPSRPPAGRFAPDVGDLLTTSRVEWSEVAGLDEAAQSLRLAIALLVARPPEAVRISPPRAVLLYGPPGNGKTLLAAAASRSLGAVRRGEPAFYNVRLPFVLSKYFGESSRIVAEIYRAARERAPALIFVDEIDALARDRDADESGPERRILATLLSELDGLAEKKASPPVLTIAATNRPWDLDPAVLSRFDRRVLVPLPDRDARLRILGLHLPGPDLVEDAVLGRLADRTEGYGGRDLGALVQWAVEAMLAGANPDLARRLEDDPESLRQNPLRIEPLSEQLFARALERVGPRDARAAMARYHEWNRTMGA